MTETKILERMEEVLDEFARMSKEMKEALTENLINMTNLELRVCKLEKTMEIFIETAGKLK